MPKDQGIVFDVKHFAVHDGPGVRVTVFLKGCPLQCLWCHSPESQDDAPEIMVYPERCIGCLECVRNCPVHVLVNPGDPNPSGCIKCGACSETCYSGARTLVGKYYSVEDILREVGRDKLLIDESGGGVTVSGGEPLSQHEFTYELLRALKREGYHTALDTCGYSCWGHLERLLPYTDLVLYDLKHVDTNTHLKLVGKDNALIISNLRKLSKRNVNIVVRIPLIPGINDSKQDLKRLARLLRDMRLDLVEILPYHRLGVPKYESLGREYTLGCLETYNTTQLLEIQEYLRLFGLKTTVEGLQ